MKSKEELEQLAESIYGKGKVEDYEDGFVDGYTHCQKDNKDEKYTKEQLISVYWDAYNEGKYSTDKTAEEYYKENFKQE